MNNKKTSELFCVLDMNSMEIKSIFESEELCNNETVRLNKEFNEIIKFRMTLTRYYKFTLEAAIDNIKDYASECPNCQDESY